MPFRVLGFFYTDCPPNGQVLGKVLAGQALSDKQKIEDMPEELKSKIELQDTNVYTLFRTALADGQQFAEPSEYVSFKR